MGGGVGAEIGAATARPAPRDRSEFYTFGSSRSVGKATSMIDRIMEAFCALLLLATVVIAFLAVIFRYVIGSSLSWSFEATVALLTYLTFIGSYLAMRKNAHLKVEVLVARLPASAHGPIYFFNQLVIAAIAVVMIAYGLRQTLLFAKQTSLVMEVPLWVLYVIIPASGLLILLQALVELANGWRRWRRGEPLFAPGEPDAAATKGQ
ncbi:MAG: TRAP transporter small permease subunit [Rhizobiales bacterium]|nr:TRAP transporter small permease subunit [Hyphomicrobiales bacterium]